MVPEFDEVVFTGAVNVVHGPVQTQFGFHLLEVTSQHLALRANVASIYENQRGIRLLVQELILTPDSDDYDDIPFDDNGGTLDDFADWTQRWRPESTYGQTVAIRFGDGLSGGILGIAFQNALHTRNGVGVLRTGFGWALTSHEMGHVWQSATRKMKDKFRGGYKKLWKCKDGKYRNYLNTA